MANLGYIGLGVMGSRVAKRLMDAGHTVTGHDLYKEKAESLIAAGMKWADSPREVAENVDIVLSMVTNTNAVLAITQGENGIFAGFGPGKLYIDMSTIDPEVTRANAEKARELGGNMLDCTVSGSVSTLEEGKLSMMVGGDEDVFEKVLPILKAIGPVVTRVGVNGQAIAMKIAVNLSLSVQMVAFSEAVLIAEKSGIPRETAVEVLLNSVIASPMIKYRGPWVLGQEEGEEVWFNCNMMQKDMLLALKMGRDLDVPMPTTAITNELYTACRGIGVDQKDMAAVFDVLAVMSGVEP
jgi:3-hydroxyisobutyrate dehydrogenase-like beta-hydroxyacid dehydrogenase